MDSPAKIDRHFSGVRIEKLQDMHIYWVDPFLIRKLERERERANIESSLMRKGANTACASDCPRRYIHIYLPILCFRHLAIAGRI